MSILLIVILILLCIGVIPQWGYHSYGYAPVGIGTVLLILLIVLVIGGRL